MNPSLRDLERRAQQFAGEIADLLNGTVTQGIRLKCGLNGHGQAIVTYEANRLNRRGETIPLTISRTPPKLFLRVFHALKIDRSNGHLANVKSAYGLFVGDETDAVPPVVAKDAVAPVALGYAGDNPDTSPAKEDMNTSSQARIGRSSSVSAPE